MTAARGKIIDGKAIAAAILHDVAEEVRQLQMTKNIIPGIAFIAVGDDPASKVYIERKAKTAKELGIQSFVHKFGENSHLRDLPLQNATIQQELVSKAVQQELVSKAVQQELVSKAVQQELASKVVQQILAEIERLNAHPNVHGILVQLPLPKHLSPYTQMITNAVAPSKDVDGFTFENVGRLATGQDGLVPCTPQGCIHLIKTVCPDMAGLHAVVVGRSNVVGRPLADLLLRENCTVTTIHSRTPEPEKLAQQADILVAATGRAGLITENWVKPGAIVIDVGISRVDATLGTSQTIAEELPKTKLVGDVRFNQVIDKVKAITPVPGGVGPMTIAYLMKNTLKALRNGL